MVVVVQPSGKDEVTATIRAFDGSPFYAAPESQFLTKSHPDFYRTGDFSATTVRRVVHRVCCRRHCDMLAIPWGVCRVCSQGGECGCACSAERRVGRCG